MRAALIATALIAASTAQAEDRWLILPLHPAMPAATSTGMAPVNGIEMYYATFGTATAGRDPILLIHGGLGHADIWAAQVADLMPDHLGIVGDSRGHGRSPRNADPYGYDLMAADYLALLDYLKMPKVDLVGWSDGGIIGIDLALHHPDRLDRLFAQAADLTVDGVDPGVNTKVTFGNFIT